MYLMKIIRFYLVSVKNCMDDWIDEVNDYNNFDDSSIYW